MLDSLDNRALRLADDHRAPHACAVIEADFPITEHLPNGPAPGKELAEWLADSIANTTRIVADAEDDQAYYTVNCDVRGQIYSIIVSPETVDEPERWRLSVLPPRLNAWIRWFRPADVRAMNVGWRELASTVHAILKSSSQVGEVAWYDEPPEFATVRLDRFEHPLAETAAQSVTHSAIERLILLLQKFAALLVPGVFTAFGGGALLMVSKWFGIVMAIPGLLLLAVGATCSLIAWFGQNLAWAIMLMRDACGLWSQRAEIGCASALVRTSILLCGTVFFGWLAFIGPWTVILTLLDRLPN